MRDYRGYLLGIGIALVLFAAFEPNVRRWEVKTFFGIRDRVTGEVKGFLGLPIPGDPDNIGLAACKDCPCLFTESKSSESSSESSESSTESSESSSESSVSSESSSESSGSETPVVWDGPGYYCVSTWFVAGLTSGPVLTCADMSRMTTGCEFYADEEQFDNQQFGICEDQSDEFNYTFSMKTVNSGPHASQGICEDNCQ
jgi:hypothetical protein